MAATSGPMPWSDIFSSWRRSTKKQREGNWNFATGWVPSDIAAWQKSPERQKMKKLISSAGTEYYMPDSDYDTFLGFVKDSEPSELSEVYKSLKKSKNVNTPADYIDFAFNESKAKVYMCDGCGHIKRLWYTATYQLLKVEFTNNGAIVVFFRLPKEVAGELIVFAENKQTQISSTDGTERHTLGIRFWDLVRIRGTMHGARYKFQYAQEGSTSGGTVGRAYGSGEHLYVDKGGLKYNQDKEMLYTKNKAKEVIRQLKKDDISNDATINKIEEAYHEKMTEMLNDENNVRKTARRINLESAVERLPDALINEFNEKEGNVDIDKLRRKYHLNYNQFRALKDARDATVGREQVIKNYNETRAKRHTWNREALNELVEKVFSGDGANNFRSKFSNPAKQFDYLKSRGYIPADAIYKKE